MAKNNSKKKSGGKREGFGRTIPKPKPEVKPKTKENE